MPHGDLQFYDSHYPIGGSVFGSAFHQELFS